MPPIKTANPFSFLFLFFLILFIVSLIVILSPVILVLLIVILFYAIFARERLTRANRKFRESPFVHRYFHTRAGHKDAEADPDVVDVGFTVVKEDDPENTGRAR